MTVRIRLDFSPTTRGPLIFTDPLAVISAYQYAQVLPALYELESWTRRGYWVAGFLSYEAAYGLLEELTRPPRPSSRSEDAALPLLEFGVFTAPGAMWPDTGRGNYTIGAWRPDPWLDRAVYDKKIAQIRRAIAQGLTYQINYTLRLRASFHGNPWPYYRALWHAQQAPYSGYIEWGDQAILSASPELFFALHGQHIVTRPMKGTAQRGRYDAEDRVLRRNLEQSAKDRAENIMIADLFRNDLGRLAQTGTVRVAALCQPEAYPTVWQLTSEITAERDPAASWVRVLTTLFPSGSITGAPKLSSMNIIQELEASPRGIYCGTLGYVSPYGREAVFNVAIRTVWIHSSRHLAVFGTGGGITWDSRAEEEYDELLTKARFLTARQPEFSLLETMRLDHGNYWLYTFHLERMEQAAAYYQRPFDKKAVEGTLDGVRKHYADKIWRVRVMVDPNGQVHHQVVAYQKLPAGVQMVAWASQSVDSADPIFFHKTTHRDFYNRAHPGNSQAFDHLLSNEQGLVTEFTRGNIVLRYRGELITPAQDSGLLAGTFRRFLLSRQIIQEARISKEHVRSSDQIWFINSLYGWVPVKIAE